MWCWKSRRPISWLAEREAPVASGGVEGMEMPRARSLSLIAGSSVMVALVTPRRNQVIRTLLTDSQHAHSDIPAASLAPLAPPGNPAQAQSIVAISRARPTVFRSFASRRDLSVAQMAEMICAAGRIGYTVL